MVLKKYLFFLVCFFSIFQSLPSEAQVDTTNTHSPRRATIYSAVLPGLGQAYNKKYWKIPIIYAGLGLTGYFFVANQQEFQRTRKAIIARGDGDSTTVDNDFTDPRYNDAFLQDRKNFYRRNRDLSAIIGILIYAANIIDADVDAHLFNFNVDDNLSLRIVPATGRDFTGLALSLNF